jgi:hypothetical protein
MKNAMEVDMKLEAKHHAMVVLATTAVNGTRPRGSTTSSSRPTPTARSLLVYMMQTEEALKGPLILSTDLLDGSRNQRRGFSVE